MQANKNLIESSAMVDNRIQLAHERTILSLERTILAYIRTSAAVALVGITLIKLLDWPIFGFVCLFFALLILLVCIRPLMTRQKFIRVRRNGFDWQKEL